MRRSWHRAIGRLVRTRLERIASPTWALLALQAAAILYGARHPGLSSGRLLEVLFASLSLLLLTDLARLTTAWLGGVGYALFVLFHFLWIPLIAYRCRTGYPLRYDLFRNTYEYLFLPDVLHWTLFENGFEVPLVLAGGLLLLAYLGVADRSVRLATPRERRGPSLLVSIVFYAPFLLVPRMGADGLTFFMRSTVRFQGGSPPSHRLETSSYPYVKGVPGDAAGPRGRDDLPHVFVLFLESFNARYVETRTPQGEAYTPFLDSLIPRGVFVDRFYSNSVHTIRGQEATLCGILPSITDRISVANPGIHLNCLPRIFRSLGYTTLYFQGYHDLGFDNTGAFMEHIGFEGVHAMTGEFITAADEPFIWGWGIQDDVLYRKIFEHLDRLWAASSGEGREKRFFVATQSTTNHMWFDKVPEQDRSLFENPRSLHENYANSVHLADRYLGEFFRQLQARPYLANSLIVLVGDHSFPTTDRGYPNYALDDFSEEGARTVLLILWRPERLSPRRIGHSAHSQVDIAPSLLDLLHLNVPNHFIGTSIFDPAPEMQSTIFVIQPFGGQYVSVIEPPIKYVMHLESGMEFLFDLDIDPDQKNNLIWRMRETGVAEHFRKELQKVYLNQRLIEDDRIWPQ